LFRSIVRYFRAHTHTHTHWSLVTGVVPHTGEAARGHAPQSRLLDKSPTRSAGFAREETKSAVHGPAQATAGAFSRTTSRDNDATGRTSGERGAPWRTGHHACTHAHTHTQTQRITQAVHTPRRSTAHCNSHHQKSTQEHNQQGLPRKNLGPRAS